MLQLAFAMVIWGTLGVFALWSGLSAYELTFYRCLIGAFVLGIFCCSKKYFRKDIISRSDIFFALISGLFIVLNWILLFKSFQLASITIGNVSYYLQPVFLVILGIVFFKDKVTPKQWVYILMTTAGVMLTSNPGASLSNIDHSLMMGLFCAIGAGLLYAFATVFVKYIQIMPPALITFIQLSSGCILLIPLILVSDLHHLNLNAVSNILVMGVFHTSVAYILYYQGLNRVNLTMVAVLSYIDPIVAIGTDILFFDRTLNTLQTSGILLTFIGSYQVIRLKKSQEGRMNYASRVKRSNLGV